MFTCNIRLLAVRTPPEASEAGFQSAAKTYHCHAGRNDTLASDVSEQQAAQQLLGSILGLLGLNMTDLANSTSENLHSNSTSMSDNSLFG